MSDFLEKISYMLVFGVIVALGISMFVIFNKYKAYTDTSFQMLKQQTERVEGDLKKEPNKEESKDSGEKSDIDYDNDIIQTPTLIPSIDFNTGMPNGFTIIG